MDNIPDQSEPEDEAHEAESKPSLKKMQKRELEEGTALGEQREPA